MGVILYMQLSRKIRLYPTKEQEELFKEFSNTARFAYNESLAFRKQEYENGNCIGQKECIKHLQDLKYSDYAWLQNTPEAVTKQAIKDLDKAYKKFFKEKKGFPKFHKRGKTPLSFYQRTDNFRQIDDTHIKITGVKSPVKCKKCKIPDKVVNTRVKFDGKYWYLSYTYEKQEKTEQLHDKALGIDLGIKEYVICSDGTVYGNINKKERVLKLEKRKKRLQRQVSRKYQMNKQGNKFIKTENIKKTEQQIRLIDRKLSNIRDTYVHTVTKQIVLKRPKAIVIEDLNVKGMMKNRHLSHAVGQQNFRKTREYLSYKAKLYSIPIIIADRMYPSSKKCSCCGYIKKDLKLRERVYKCTICGFSEDRDFNASLNLEVLAY